MDYRDTLNTIAYYTDNFNSDSGEVHVATRASLNDAISILSKHYKHVHTIYLDTQDGNNDTEYRIGYDTPILTENFDVNGLNFMTNKNPSGTPMGESVEIHNELNRDIFDGDVLKPKVKNKLESIVLKFKDTVKEQEDLDLEIIDVAIAGSMAAYNYTSSSDIDLDIVANLSKYGDAEDLAQKLYWALKTLWNDKYAPLIYGHEVELYIDADKCRAKSNGIYSIYNGWLKKPTKDEIPEIDQKAIDAGVKPFVDRLNNAKTITEFSSLEDDLYKLRFEGIFRNGGEYSIGNLIYKEFRNKGYMDKLEDKKIEMENNDMSINEADYRYGDLEHNTEDEIYDNIRDYCEAHHYMSAISILVDELTEGALKDLDEFDLGGGVILKRIGRGFALYKDGKHIWTGTIRSAARELAQSKLGIVDESLTEDADEVIDDESEQQQVEPEGVQQAVLDAANGVMAAYQNANKWLDTTKEVIYTDLSCVFFSSYVHSLAHTMPERFDKFGDILHTCDIKIPYPATSNVPFEVESIDTSFKMIFTVLDAIKTALNDFISITDSDYHGMSCAAEGLLNDIESEYPMLYRLNKEWVSCNGDLIKFDKYVNQYINNKANLLEALDDCIEYKDTFDIYDAVQASKNNTLVESLGAYDILAAISEIPYEDGDTICKF